MHDFVQDIPSTWNPLFSSHLTPSLLNIEIGNFISFKVCFTLHLLQLHHCSWKLSLPPLNFSVMV